MCGGHVCGHPSSSYLSCCRGGRRTTLAAFVRGDGGGGGVVVNEEGARVGWDVGHTPTIFTTPRHEIKGASRRKRGCKEGARGGGGAYAPSRVPVMRGVVCRRRTLPSARAITVAMESSVAMTLATAHIRWSLLMTVSCRE